MYQYVLDIEFTVISVVLDGGYCMSKAVQSIIGMLVVALVFAATACADDDVKVDKVIVIKSERLMYLMSGDSVLKSYIVSLGKNPRGPKQQKGDKKTPEGLYVLDRRNAKSKYYKSIHISYPNEEDRRRAAAKGVDPGGDIVLHGLPTNSEDEAWDYIERDWTDGCIAVTNVEMEEIWNLVEDNTPIEIVP
jgi:murein L,D-transpeptidase YafK